MTLKNLIRKYYRLNVETTSSTLTKFSKKEDFPDSLEPLEIFTEGFVGFVAIVIFY